MAHFAELDENDIVIRVIVVDNNEVLNPVTGVEDEIFGKVWCIKNVGYTEGVGVDWVQTSYNSNFRKKYAGEGDTYDRQRDAFIYPKPRPTWVLNEDDCNWYPPVEKPPLPDDESYVWTWDDDIVNWTKRFRDS